MSEILRNPDTSDSHKNTPTGKTQEEAARFAGPNPTRPRANAAWRLLAIVGVAERVEELKEQLGRRVEWNAAKVLERLKEQADAAWRSRKLPLQRILWALGK